MKRAAYSNLYSTHMEFLSFGLHYLPRILPMATTVYPLRFPTVGRDVGFRTGFIGIYFPG